METKPTQIAKVNENALRIEWSGGKVSIIASETLRASCPCALCREKRGESSHDTPISTPQKRKSSLTIVDSTLKEAQSIVRIWAVGNYALGIEWGDGHTEGIYDWPMLQAISAT